MQQNWSLDHCTLITVFIWFTQNLVEKLVRYINTITTDMYVFQNINISW